MPNSNTFALAAIPHEPGLDARALGAAAEDTRRQGGAPFPREREARPGAVQHRTEDLPVRATEAIDDLHADGRVTITSLRSCMPLLSTFLPGKNENI